MEHLKKLIIFSVLFISYNAHAVQNDPNVVLENEWFLQSLTIDGEEMTPPFSEEIGFVYLYFDIGNPEEEPPFVITSMCREIISTAYVSSEMIHINSISPIPFINCQLQENIDYDELYFNFLASSIEFPYELIETDDFLQLILTAPNGDQAIYANQSLSVEERKAISFQVYPNPVQDLLYVNAPDVSIKKIRVYTSLGEEVKNSSSQVTIDVQGLSKGIYFVVITSDQGSAVKKIIVE